MPVVSFDNRYYIFAFEKDKEEGGKPFTEYRLIEVTKGDTNDGFTEISYPLVSTYKTPKS
jgi:cobalt-zinc-cadmium efflux system membrane fusion protein